MSNKTVWAGIRQGVAEAPRDFFAPTINLLRWVSGKVRRIFGGK